MSTTVQKWGNSLGVRIPQRVAKQFNVVSGSEVEIIVEKDGILIKPISKKPTLEELMSGITKDNQHDEIDFGQAEGKEIW